MHDEQTLNNDGQLPGWVKELKAKDKARHLAEEAEHQVSIAKGLRIQHEGSKIVSDFLSELSSQIEDVKKIGFSGSATPKSKSGSDHVSHVEVTLPGRPTHTNIFYTKGDDEIRFRTLEGKTFKLVLVVVGDRLRLRRENSADTMDAKQAAEWLVKQMCFRLSKRYA